MKQLPLTESVTALLKEQGRKLLLTAGMVIASEVKQSDYFANLIDVRPSQLSSAVRDNGYHFDLKWIPALIYIDQRRRFLTHQAQLAGCRVLDAELTDTEYRLRMEQALRRAGPAGEAIRRDALDGEEP